VSVLGVLLGVVALVVVTSVINGFQGELVKVITGMNGHVILYSRGEAISEPSQVEAKIRQTVPEAIAITRSMITELMVSGSSGVAGAILEGVDLATVDRVTNLRGKITSGRLPQKSGEVAIGDSLASRIGAKVGAEIRVIVPFAGVMIDESTSDGTLSNIPKSVSAVVVGIVKMGMHQYDSKFVYTTLEAAQEILEQPDKVSSFKILLPQGVDSRKVSDRLSENFGYPFRAKDWGQLNKNIFYAIELEKVVIAIIMTIIVIVAAFNVVSTLMMMIYDKTKEIAILKAMGFKPTQSFGLFCLIGLGIGMVGTLGGLGLGLFLNWVLRTTRLIELPADVYYIGYLPVKENWVEIGMIVGVSMIITLLATFYPAYKVSTRSPLEGIRYE
jgi:lipoprotein-releasing system permease protein